MYATTTIPIDRSRHLDDGHTGDRPQTPGSTCASLFMLGSTAGITTSSVTIPVTTVIDITPHDESVVLQVMRILC